MIAQRQIFNASITSYVRVSFKLLYLVKLKSTIKMKVKKQSSRKNLLRERDFFKSFIYWEKIWLIVINVVKKSRNKVLKKMTQEIKSKNSELKERSRLKLRRFSKIKL